MGANAQTSVPAFTAGQVLTAAQMTQVNTGIPVFADSTARDAAFGGTGEKTLAEGQMAYLEDTNATQYYDGSSWATIDGGLVLVTSSTFSAVSSVSIDGCFTSTYRNYRIVLENVNSTTSENRVRLRASSTDNTDAVYDRANVYNSSGGTSGQNSVAQDHWRFDTNFAAVINARSFDVYAPALAERTFVNEHSVETAGTDIFVSLSGLGHRNATAYDGFTYYAVSGTITGTLRVYGYED